MFTLVLFSFATVTYVVYTTLAFLTLENRDFQKCCKPHFSLNSFERNLLLGDFNIHMDIKSPQYHFSLKTLGLCFRVNEPKRRLLKTMEWLVTIILRILDDCVNNNVMLIVVPAWMVMWRVFGFVVWTEIVSEKPWKLQCRLGVERLLIF